MKKILSILSITILSTTAQVEANTVQAEQTVISDSQQTKLDEMTSLKLSKRGDNESTLWETLDTDKDGSISKAEASASNIVTENWENLDRNKDEKLDIAEFSKLYSQEL